MHKNPKQEKERVEKPGKSRSKPDGHELPDHCATHCDPVATKRTRYYPGRYLTAYDFRLEQGYFLSRHRLHNRLLHGYGIVCGLEVHPHPNPNCANHVIIRPGIAIDCCGREIILEEPQVVVVWDADNPPQGQPRHERPEETGEYEDEYGEKPGQPYEERDLSDEEREPDYEDQDQGYEQQDPKKQYPQEEHRPEEPREEEEPAYLIYVCYCEEESEFAPALYDDGSCGGEACGGERLEANRICELACLHVIPWDPANRKSHAGCWPEHVSQPQPCRDDCEGRPDAPKTGCLEPDCRCNLCVPLAVVRPVAGNRGYAITEDSLDYSGRPELQTPSEYLTHISGINWPHGGRVPLSELRDPDRMNGQLRITFDRKLLPPDPDETATATGINESTFTVQVHRKADVQYPMAMLHNDGDPPHLDDNRCEAIFTIDDELLEGYQNLSGGLLHITLRCDFILDCHRRPVDGEHRKGVLPSGNGCFGGTFESWFWVSGDEESFRGGRRRRRQEKAE
jgi:hypothetical protein